MIHPRYDKASLFSDPVSKWFISDFKWAYNGLQSTVGTSTKPKKTDIVWFISTLNPHEHLFISRLYSILFPLIEQCSNPPFILLLVAGLGLPAHGL